MDEHRKRPIHTRTRIKICGVMDVATAEVASEAGADAVGVMFAEHSPRRITPILAREITEAVSPFITVVGVYQLETPAGSRPDVESFFGTWYQMHGQEDERFIERLRKPGRRIIKGFQFDAEQVRRWDRCDAVDALLIDGSSGGAGSGFDHEQLGEMMQRIKKPVILAGGLTAENVADAIAMVGPYAVDVSSGVESKRGRKDAGKVRAFCDAVRDGSAARAGGLSGGG